MNNKISLTAFSVLLLILVSPKDSAAQMHRGEGMMRGGMMERGKERCFGDRKFMRNTLNLNDGQIEQISMINDRYKGILIEFRDRLQPKKEELRGVLLTEIPDLDKVRIYLKEISEIEVELRIIKIKQSLEIEKIFTPDQRERMRKERRMNRD